MNTNFDLVNVSTLRTGFVGRFRTSGAKLTDQDFADFCRQNPELQIEQTAAGEIIIMPPTGGTTGIRNFSLIFEFGKWQTKNKSQGFAFDSSTIFVLSNSAKRSPDLSWVKAERWNRLTREQQDKFPPLCPDFVVELRSKSDSLKTLQAKMLEYIENGAQLGWLIDPTKRKIHVYSPVSKVEILDAPAEISGEPLLPKFSLKLKDFWK